MQVLDCAATPWLSGIIAAVAAGNCPKGLSSKEGVAITIIVKIACKSWRVELITRRPQT